jgi:hypothetical protein
MQKRFTGRQRILLSLGFLGGFALLASSGANAAESAARVTAAVGTAVAGDEALEQRGALEEGAELETGDDGNCSLLVDEDALMELCGGTSLRLDRKGGLPEGPRVVTLERGEIRMLVEPRLGEERIEIHTPAAIATILGTVVHVSVDALGVTTITSAANKVLIESADPSVSGSTTIDGGQQVVMAPGEAPPQQPSSISQQVMSSLGGCLIDFHEVSLRGDRATQMNQKVDEIVNEDVADAATADVAAAAGATGGQGQIVENAVNEGQSRETNTDIYTQLQDETVQQILSGGGLPSSPGGACPPGLPGDTCDF